mmetsp:Transcript_26571/g.81688  ORF Transcript_26571/g.81688 Transcript_26571/m.81688 type:complete len:88 (-) Transcript_26571:3162-3425(-)
MGVPLTILWTFPQSLRLELPNFESSMRCEGQYVFRCFADLCFTKHTHVTVRLEFGAVPSSHGGAGNVFDLRSTYLVQLCVYDATNTA